MFRTWRDLLKTVGFVITFNIACILVGWGIYLLVTSFR